jgi:hypothetical protein
LIIFRIEQKDVLTETGFSAHTTCDWANLCREVCIDEVIKQETRIGGVGTIVEIDESLFGKQKFGRGELHDGQWVFGGVQRGTGECFLVGAIFIFTPFYSGKESRPNQVI